MPKLNHFKVIKEDTQTVLLNVTIDGKTFECAADTYQHKRMYTIFEISTGKPLSRKWFFTGLSMEYTIRRLYEAGVKEWNAK
jgi:hypothetical protein